MIRDGLYHFELGLPQKNILPSEGFLALKYSMHAQSASLLDRYGIIDLPSRIAFRACKLIEAEYLNGQIAKLVLRVPYTETLDLVLAVKPNGFVKTVWLNKASDKHATLDRTKYIVLKRA